jgi:ribonucleoside-diphosphate reductase alpha chain
MQSPVSENLAADWPPISAEIWDMKYRLKAADGTSGEVTYADTVARVADAVAGAEKPELRALWASRYGDAMGAREFLPGGRILAGAGADRNVTLFNCFVMGRIEDDLSAIFDGVKEAARTLQAGGGIGHDFSTLRPRGAPVRSIGADASGPIAFMDVWDTMCRSIMSAGQRRGAMMATLQCDHPDIEAFIEAKRDPQRLRNFNLSVLVTDAFVDAVRQGADWPLVFDGQVFKTVSARDLWGRLMRATYDVAEPGVIFIDRVNDQNNLAYCETIAATNPCGEQPLPAHGACLLGAINLARLVRNPFVANAALDEDRLGELASVATRFLDATIDVSRYPLPAQQKEAFVKRRIGLGVTGLADALIQVGVRYGSAEAARLTGHWLQLIKHAAYRASAGLAVEKGAFPLCDAAALLARPNLAALPIELRAKIAATGLRNGVLTTIAPTGTTSLLAGNVSSGIEPVFDFAYTRKILASDGSRREEQVEDYAHRLFRQLKGAGTPLPDAFVRMADLAPAEHLRMQAAAQPHIDSAISKTINCPEALAFDDFKSIYLEAHALGLKGCTTYRPNAVTGSVLSPVAAAPPASSAAATITPTPPSAVALPPVAARSTGAAGDIIYMSKPLERDTVLAGLTYKLKWPRSAHAIYITINDIEHDGRRRPFEIFINSKNLDHTAWSLALTRMISAVFRRGGDVSFVAEELQAVFDPQGGAWVDGRYVPSVQAAIGGVIETHLKRIAPAAANGTEARQRALVNVAAASGAGASQRGSKAGDSGPIKPVVASFPDDSEAEATDISEFCPRCQQRSYVRESGCSSCRSCGFSQCD